MKVYGILIGTLIAHQLHCSVAFGPIEIITGVVDFGVIVHEIMTEWFKNDTSIIEVAASIENLNQELQYDMKHVMNALKDLPSIIRLEAKKESLEGHFSMIGHVFEEASRIKKEVDQGTLDRNNSKYERFALKEHDIDHSIYEIRRTLTDSNTIFVLKQNFTEESKKFDNVCKTGKSHLQLLDALLGNIQIATAQYYLTKKFMYEFLELKGEDNSNAKQTLLRNVKTDHSNTVKKFKDIMREASLELWKCDPADGYNDTIRYTDKTDPNFAELRIFSKYIVSEGDYTDTYSICEKTTCESITKVINYKGWQSLLCRNVRSCPGKLIGCQQYTSTVITSNHMADVCRNNDRKAYHRYHSIATHDEERSDQFHCDNDDDEVTIKSTVFHTQYTLMRPCNYCNCLCEEQEHYVDTKFVRADIELNRVVTGAKLLVENNTLRIQIQQAKLMANGTIDKNTLEWKPLNPISNYHRKRISFDEYKKFALSSVMKPDDHVVTGISLTVRSEQKMIFLFVSGEKFDFRTGILKRREIGSSSVDQTIAKIPIKKYDVSERDVPTKSRKENKPDSSDGQYVELTVTNLAKDGGQSVVPFIDTQNITANGPLSGASFYVRGQPGFGGFLGLKLYTFDLRKYVVDESDL